MIKNLKRKFVSFDDITKFRLINSFLVAISMNLFVPILTDLKGEYLAAWAISMLMIGGTLMVKTNEYFVNNFTIGQLYKQGIVVHLLLVISSLIYFINPLIMVWTDGIIALFEVAVFSAYSIKLNNWLTQNYPDSMSDFQIVRNSTWADGTLIGLSITAIVTFLFGVPSGLMLFITFNTIFSAWMIYNWNFFDNYEKDILKEK